MKGELILRKISMWLGEPKEGESILRKLLNDWGTSISESILIRISKRMRETPRGWCYCNKKALGPFLREWCYCTGPLESDAIAL
jgi:hypothetical protein